MVDLKAVKAELNAEPEEPPRKSSRGLVRD
jgi:hypothetical protein